MMKFICLVLFLGSTAFTATVDSFPRLKALFATPPAEFSTLPFFVWNSDTTEEMIDLRLQDFSARGIRGFIVHPRPGLITEYLSDRWFQLIRYTADRAKRLGMEVWLYDENSYPSGFAGGHVPATMPESYNQGQGLVLQKSGSCKILLHRVGDRFEDVTGKAEPLSPDFYCFTVTQYPSRAWTAGYPYVDLLVPGVTERFIQITMSGYEKTLGPDLGRLAPGIFTDEPNIAPPGREAVKYTPDLFDQFQKRWGYDLRTNLPSLFQEVGDWRRVRHNYYSVLLDLFIERWSEPWHAYAERKGIIWTGHYWEHSWPNPMQGPDNMAMYAWHQRPGIDMLFNQFNEGVNAQFGNVRSVKELASVANQLGRRRTLSETYGGAGWDLRFEDMKRLGDWEYALGVNTMNQHLSFASIVGARKYDYPPTFSYHEPWWAYYGVLANYFARLSLALSAGEERNHILVLEPTTSAWMYAGPRPNDQMMRIGNAFQEFITSLVHRQVEFDLGCENIIKIHGRVDGKLLIVGKRSYDLVVLPPGTENLNSPTARLLRQFVQQGGRLVSYAAGELFVDGALAGLSFPHVSTEINNPNFSQLKGFLLHQRRQLQDGELWFFVNSSLDATAAATVSTKGRSLEKLDAFTGRTEVYPSRESGGRLEFSVELPPAGSLLLVATDTTPPALPSKPSPHSQLQQIKPQSPLRVERTGPNALRIDYCDLTLNGVTKKDVYFFRAADEVFKAHGFAEGNPWNSAVQFKTLILDRGRFAPDSGFDASFWFDVTQGVNIASLQAVVERPALWKVSVNGTEVRNDPGKWWLDRDFGVYSIGQLVKLGKNRITITARPMSVHNELEPVYIIGDFAVAPTDKGFQIVPSSTLRVGPWKDQHLPFYSGAVSYTQKFLLEHGGKYKVILGKWSGTVAEVRVNGKSAGIIGWQPYEIAIDSLVNNGENLVEVLVTGSLKNLLGPHHGQPARGIASPGSARSAPDTMPPGHEYDQLPYGLMEDFHVVRILSPGS
jgi:hypothetical protein